MIALRNCGDPHNSAVLKCTIDLLPTSQLVPGLSLAIARTAVLENRDASVAGTGTNGGGVAARRGVGGDGQGRGGQCKGDNGGVDGDIANIGTGTHEGQDTHENGSHQAMHRLHFDCMSLVILKG